MVFNILCRNALFFQAFGGSLIGHPSDLKRSFLLSQRFNTGQKPRSSQPNDVIPSATEGSPRNLPQLRPNSALAPGAVDHR